MPQNYSSKLPMYAYCRGVNRQLIQYVTYVPSIDHNSIFEFRIGVLGSLDEERIAFERPVLVLITGGKK